MRKAGEQVRQQSKRKKSVKACKRATGPLESEQSSAAVLRLFPHHAAFGEGRAAPGRAPGKHLAATLTTGRAHRRIEMRAVRARCWPATNNQDGPSRTETNAPCCLASPIAPTLWLIHHAHSPSILQKHAKVCRDMQKRSFSLPSQSLSSPAAARAHLNNSGIAVYENGFAFRAGHTPF